MSTYNSKAIKLHRKKKGKIAIKSKVPLRTKSDLSLAYTPGVAAVCRAIRHNLSRSWELTNRANQVAIVTDGSAVLGLGNIGPEAGMPVMEGKAAIFKEFAGIDAFPLCINAGGTEEIIQFCHQIEPSFGGINLEDISAPRCFEVLEALENKLNIPVFHDDQDGTAIVTLAALINACRVTGKDLKKLRIVINGAGAAGIAIARLLIAQGTKDIILIDSIGIINRRRKDLNKYKTRIARQTNFQNLSGRLEEAMPGADVFIGVSRADLVTEEMIKAMNPNPIIFAMANPIPEIMPQKALKAGAAIIGTGRSDFPNQINNALVFPGIFKGLLQHKIKRLTVQMKISAAMALANTIKRPTKNKILPPVTSRQVVDNIAKALKRNLVV